MLTQLYINNYAIIEKLTINFGHGLNVITGETGAGKSILMGALNLILGERADTSVLISKNEKCIVEGRFHISENVELKNYFSENDLDYDSEIVIRREINSSGKSRSFINDTPVTLLQLKAVSFYLVDLHQQFDARELSNNSFQLTILDSLADNSKILKNYKEIFLKYKAINFELNKLEQTISQAEKEKDYNRFLFSEIEELELQENELEHLSEELKVLNNSEEISRQLQSAVYNLSDSEIPVINSIKTIVQQLAQVSDLSPAISDLRNRLSSSIIELQDISGELERLYNNVNNDQERIAFVNDRLSAGYKLQKKHGVNSTAELITIKNDLQLKLEEVQTNEEKIEQLKAEHKRLWHKVSEEAIRLSESRKQQVASFSKNVNVLLKKVGMPNAELKIEISETDYGTNGKDLVTFLFNANISKKGNEDARFESLAKVGSGGELNRLMLSVKSLVAKKLQLPTLIFDEIDSGISGEAAKQVGIIMKEMSASHQIITITHQPQIAAKADNHYYVFKDNSTGAIKTSIKKLNKPEMVNAIAKMLGGENPSSAACANAKEMIEANS